MSDAPSNTSSGHHGPTLDEPQTPAWLPALGVALFAAVAVWWAAVARSGPPTDGAHEPAAPTAEAPKPAASAQAAVPVPAH
ncbi:MAG: hypothetical protein U0169_25900 [Polyangiaceae bacterium]